MRSPLDRKVRARIRAGRLLQASIGLAVVLVLAAGVARGSSSAAAPANTSVPAISGTAQQGQTLTATTGVWTGDTPISYAFQWQRCDSVGATCGAIAGATTNHFVVAAGDVGGTLRVVVAAKNASGTSSAASAPTAKITLPGSAPSATKQPDPHGTFQIGHTINVDTGSWTGTAPLSYSFQWQRCSPSGNGCNNVSGATGQTFLLSAADFGLRLRALVTATNSIGSASSNSNLTPVITAPGAPTNTASPSIANAGGLTTGAVATGSNGSWVSDQSISYSYSWSLCDGAGKNCKTIAGETRSSHAIPDSEAGSTLVFSVRASNGHGTTTANSAATAPIKPGLPAGAIRLPDGKISIPAASVDPPQRLVISDVAFSPTIIRNRNTFTSRYRITDTRGYVIRDALVYTVALPYNYAHPAAETPTGTDGYAVINITPTTTLPLSKGTTIVFFVRARKANDPLLAGVSNRRLVQIRVASPA